MFTLFNLISYRVRTPGHEILHITQQKRHWVTEYHVSFIAKFLDEGIYGLEIRVIESESESELRNLKSELSETLNCGLTITDYCKCKV